MRFINGLIQYDNEKEKEEHQKKIKKTMEELRKKGFLKKLGGAENENG